MQHLSTEPRMADHLPPLQLQPPGAGLPWLELILSRLGFVLARWLLSRKRLDAWFQAEGERMLTLAKALAPETASTPCLIPRVWGIEDSSRRWSVLMVLEHLVIVDSGITAIIRQLAAGKPSGKEISTAEVKPSAAPDMEVIERFAGCLRDYATRIGGLTRLRTQTTHRHPWFGALDGHGWHCLAALHHTVHRRQVETIIRLLRARRTSS
jgi:hypothetical protein